MKNILQQILLLAVMGIVGTIRANADTYISDVAVASETSLDAAKSDLTSAGYTVLTSYRAGSGTGDLDVGVNCGYYSVIGYKTSTDAADAITDLVFETKNYTADTYTINSLAYSKAAAYGRGYIGHQDNARYYLYYSKTRVTSGQTLLQGLQINDNGSASSDYFVKGYNGTSLSSNNQDLNSNVGGSTGHYIYIYMNKVSHDHSQDAYTYDTSNHWCKCSCGYIYSLQTAHTLTYKDNGDGTYTHSCNVCGYSTLAHTFTITANADGTYTHSCNVCGYSTLAHTFTITTNADGSKKAECACGTIHTFAADDESMSVCTTCNHGFFRYTADGVVTPKEKENLLGANDAKLKIISNTCTDRHGVIEFDKPLVIIGQFAFQDCTGFTGSLTIPNSVTTIGNYAFYNCTGFTGSLTIPNSVTTIGTYAFCYNGFTGDLTIPNSVITVGNGAFYGCTGFTGNLTIPNSVTSIGGDAFTLCTGFTGSLTIPNSVMTIGEDAFFNCSGFTGSLTIPNSVTTIGNHAFSGCTGFTGNLTIPNSVTSIEAGAFSRCTGFTGSLTIPNSVMTIGEDAFSNCSGFTGIELNSIPSFGSYVFYNCTSNKTLNLTDDSYVYTGSNKYFPTLASAPTYTRTTSKELETIVLPFDITVDGSQPYKFYEASSLEGSALVATSLTGTVKAGTPMFIKTDASEVDGKTYTLTLTAANTSVDATTALTATEVGGLTLTGTYQNKDVMGEAGYYFKNGGFAKIGSENCVISPFRAYLAGSNDASSISLTLTGRVESVATIARIINYLNGKTTDAAGLDVNGDSTVDLQDVEDAAKRLLNSQGQQ